MNITNTSVSSAQLTIRFTGPKAGELKAAFCNWFGRIKTQFYVHALTQGQSQKPTSFVSKEGVVFSFENNFVLKQLFSDWLRLPHIQESWEAHTFRARVHITHADSDYNGNRTFTT